MGFHKPQKGPRIDFNHIPKRLYPNLSRKFSLTYILKNALSRHSRSLNEDLADVIPTHLAKLKQSCPFVDPTFDLNNDKEVSKGLELAEIYEKIWATSIALKWLARRWSQYNNEWVLVLNKAQRWLKHQRLPSGFNLDDVNLMAQQTVGVLLSNSRKSSTH